MRNKDKKKIKKFGSCIIRKVSVYLHATILIRDRCASFKKREFQDKINKKLMDNDAIIIRDISKKREQINSIEKSPYPNRNITFKTISSESFKEIHVDKGSGKTLTREYRKSNFPEIKYYFLEYDITVIIKHEFLDELEQLLPLFKKNIDAECITSQMKIGEKEYQGVTIHTSVVNKFPYDYFSIAEWKVKNYLDDIASKKRVDSFLKNEYQKFSQQDKVQYLFNRVLAEERMQGGYPTGYKKSVVPYISKWYKELYENYDSQYVETLIKLLSRFEIHPNIDCINELLNYQVTSSEWKEIARKNKLYKGE